MEYKILSGEPNIPLSTIAGIHISHCSSLSHSHPHYVVYIICFCSLPKRNNILTMMFEMVFILVLLSILYVPVFSKYYQMISLSISATWLYILVCSPQCSIVPTLTNEYLIFCAFSSLCGSSCIWYANPSDSWGWEEHCNEILYIYEYTDFLTSIGMNICVHDFLQHFVDKNGS